MIALSKWMLPLFGSLLVLSLIHAGVLQAAEYETRTNREGSVTVKISPGDLSLSAPSWDFEVALSSHTTELDQDMQSVAVLVAGPGSSQPPLAWEGDPPGGHHRKGVLRFEPAKGAPGFVELHINGIGGVSQRVFRWAIGE